MDYFNSLSKGTRVAGQVSFNRTLVEAPFYKHTITATVFNGTIDTWTFTLITKDAVAYTTTKQFAAALYATGKDAPGTSTTPDFINGLKFLGLDKVTYKAIASANGTALVTSDRASNTMTFTDSVSTPTGLEVGSYYNVPNQYMQTPGNGWSGIATYTFSDYIQLELFTEGNYSSAVYGNIDYLKYQKTGAKILGGDYRADTGYLWTNILKKPYSTTETLTGDYWIDGKPIYRRVFTGNVVAAAGASNAKQLATGIAMLVNWGGLWNPGNDARVGWGSGDSSNTSMAIVESTGALTLRTQAAAAREGTTLNDYTVWAEYTKA
jgi:hypothetical protein